MKITLIGLNDTEVNILPDLGSALSKKISGVEISERFAPVSEDLPIIALDSAAESEFIIVYAPIDDDEEADFIKKKLVDVELSTKTRILKIVDEEFGIRKTADYAFESEKEKVVEKIADRAVNILFNERAFTPKKKDFE
ncbi:MAG: hypothetical protein WCI04_07110 [archaeon]